MTSISLLTRLCFSDLDSEVELDLCGFSSFEAFSLAFLPDDVDDDRVGRWEEDVEDAAAGAGRLDEDDDDDDGGMRDAEGRVWASFLADLLGDTISAGVDFLGVEQRNLVGIKQVQEHDTINSNVTSNWNGNNLSHCLLGQSSHTGLLANKLLRLRDFSESSIIQW